ncbi:alpha/beta fold hydrolase [Sediminispirochaeta smaragdinae]|uniref:Alpha/beta hydrolase fold protein n=1 Tax=Sediminispirochaeta smaragdinae (strain DSM 11293 / JCM 15392 / SEBR 4228) TaxID=573413 RepID=E1RBS1_SEDSS|nr:alpha/beta hydrolase [Sediminispirochaeta smaragdinae]ADK79801.1 alpha/beta hydrolase fold protein [Sediminispirochaeta smaragdinae DSM 11293]
MPYFNFQGKKIFYSVKGEGPLLIILPGNTATSAAHENELTYFSDRYCTVSLDFLGTGKSDRIKQWNSDWWEDSSHQVAALVEHLNYKEAVLLGISGGAIIAIAVAINHPDYVKAVVADSFSLHFTEEMYKNNVLKERANITEQQQTFWSSMHGSDWQDVVHADTEMIEMVVKEGGFCINGRPENIKCPVLLTYSEKDSFLPNVKEIAAGLGKRISNCEVRIFLHGDHPLIWTNSREFFQTVDEFLLKL